MPPTNSKPTRVEAVWEAIRAEVLSARVPPATKMKLADYAERFDVSLSLVREAMNRLADQGILQANPQRGFSTRPLSIRDLRELTRARIVIETATLRESIAAGGLDWEADVVAAHHRLAATDMYDATGAINPEFGRTHREFHIALLAGSGNLHLESIATSLRDQSELYQYWSQNLRHGSDRDVPSEHRALAELTVARKVDEAVEALTGHIQATTDSLEEYAAANGLDVESTATLR